MTQEAFLRVWRGSGSFRGGAAKGWLLRIALNLARDALRRRRREAARLADLPEPEGNPGPAAPEVAAALARLPAPERTTIVLRYWEGLTFAQAAAALGVSLRTAKYRAARGLEKLRRFLDHD